MIFNKNKFTSVAEGEFCPIHLVPDEVFSTKMMGEGFAIKEHDGNIYSPLKGSVDSVFPTKHAIVLKTEKDVPMLIHMGLETVNLNQEEAFDIHVKVGDKVNYGDLIAKMNLEMIEEANFDSIVIAVLTDKNAVSINIEQGHLVKQTDTVMKLEK